MRFEGTFAVAAPRERVWAFLTDPKAVTSCAPDVRSVEVIDATDFKMVVRAGIGPIRAVFNVKVELTEIRTEEHLTVLASGEAPGSTVEMRTTIDLEGGQPTTVRWASEVALGGLIAKVGERFLPSVVDQLTQQLFDCVRGRLETR